MNETTIEWAFDARGRTGLGYTTNPVRGCSKDDEDCDNCYAMRLAGRFSGPGGAFEGFAERPKGGGKARWTTKLAVIDDKVDDLLTTTVERGSWVFLGSMSDIFHKKLADSQVDEVVVPMLMATHLRIVTLTKRTERRRAYFADPGVRDRWHRIADRYRKRWPHMGGIGIPPADQLPAHIYWGMSAGNQRTFDKRVADFIDSPGRKVLSLEPLIGEIDPTVALWRETRSRRTDVEWVIVGGESGPGRRRGELAWVRKIRDEVDRSDFVAPCTFFFKQWVVEDGVDGLGHSAKRLMKASEMTPKTVLSTPWLDGVHWNKPPKMYATDPW